MGSRSIPEVIFYSMNKQLAKSGSDAINQATGSYWLPPYIYPPAEAEDINDFAYVALPAIGSSAVILSRTIDPAYNAVFLSLANNFVGGGWTEGSGAVIWQILIDGASAGTSYDSIPGSLGSPSNPVRLASFLRVFESSTIQLIVTNVSVVLAGQLSGGRWQGYFYPKEYEDPNFGGQ